MHQTFFSKAIPEPFWVVERYTPKTKNAEFEQKHVRFDLAHRSHNSITNQLKLKTYDWSALTLFLWKLNRFQLKQADLIDIVNRDKSIFGIKLQKTFIKLELSYLLVLIILGNVFNPKNNFN